MGSLSAFPHRAVSLEPRAEWSYRAVGPPLHEVDCLGTIQVTPNQSP